MALTEAAKQARRAHAKKYRQNMTEAQKEARREYHRKWQQANKDKVEAAQARYWDKKAAEAAQTQ